MGLLPSIGINCAFNCVMFKDLIWTVWCLSNWAILLLAHLGLTTLIVFVKFMSYPMNPYALRTCAVVASCHVLTDLKLNIVEFSAFVIQFPGTLPFNFS